MSQILSRLLNVVLFLGLIAAGIYHLHYVQVSKDADRLIDLDDETVPLPPYASEMQYFRDLYPYRTGVITASGYKIFTIECSGESTVCVNEAGETISTIQEAAWGLPEVKQEDIHDGIVRCTDNICRDFRGRIVGASPR